MNQPKLAIAIPTYARSPALRANLPLLLAEADALQVKVYLSDDSTDDETEVLAAELSGQHPNLFYRRNRPALRHDQNILQTLAWPSEEYVWILGDVFRPIEGALADVLAFISGQDFVFINWQAEDVAPKHLEEGEAAYKLLRHLTWHQALTGATIYHRRVIDWASQISEGHRNFPQLSIILGYAENNSPTIGWFGRKILHAEPKAASYWHDTALDVFVDDWVSVIESHPRVIPKRDLVRVLRSHSAATKLFNVEFLRTLRLRGAFGFGSLRRRHFWNVMHLKPAEVMSVLIVAPVEELFCKTKHRLRLMADMRLRRR